MAEARMTHNWDLGCTVRSDVRELALLVATLIAGLSAKDGKTPDLPEIETDPIQLHPFRSQIDDDGKRVSPEQRTKAKQAANQLTSELANLQRLRDPEQVAAVIKNMVSGGN